MRIYLEITNNCNKSCDFCVQSKREKGFISIEKFRARINKLKEFTDELYLHILGEPLLHPKINDFFAILAEAQLNFKITSNGTLLNDSKCDCLIQNPFFKQINFSLHALSEEEINSDVFEKILNFSQKLLLSRDDVFINFRLWNYSTADEAKNVIILQKVADFFKLNPIIIPQNRRSKKLCERLYLNIDKRFDWPTTLKDIDNDDKIYGYCHGGSSQLGVLLDGRVVPCCLDSEGEINLGNIDEADNFAEILNSARLIRLIENFKNNQIAEPFCKKCTFRKRFFKE